jgi:hypothetical protein
MANQPAAVPPPVHTGRCLCGAVRYALTGPLRPVVACHCGQCRRTSGHFAAATAVPPERLRVVQNDGFALYHSSAAARRGFCGHCGSNLFWASASGERISVMAGTLDKPTRARARHAYLCRGRRRLLSADRRRADPPWR